MWNLLFPSIPENLCVLVKVASGGELSRIMLAIKTVLADRDDVDTVIFDEIDAGSAEERRRRYQKK